MLIPILLTVVVLITALVAFAATRPDSFRIVRSAQMHAPPERIFPQVEDFHQWAAWSPWEKLDPALKRSFSGSERGTGAVYAWEGNNKVGQGRMEITEATAPSRVAIDLEFIKPWQARNVTIFSFAPEGDGTRVTWDMQGQANFMSKLMGIFMNMDKMVGTDFERGLANLKGIAERQPEMAGSSAS